MKSIWLKIVETSGARVYSLLAGIAALIITARLLGPDGRGVLAAVTAWIGLISTFASLSLGQVAIYRISKGSELQWLPKTFGTLLFFALVLSFLGIFIAVVVFQVTHGQAFQGLSPSVLVLGFSMLPFLVWEQYGSYLLMAVNQLRAYNVSQVVGRTVGLGAIIVLVAFCGLGISGAIIAQIAGQMIVAMWGVWILWRLSNHKLCIDKIESYELLKGAAKLHLNTIGAFLLGQTDVLMLNHFATKSEVGWYQFSYQLIMVMLIIPHAVSMVFFTKMAEVGPDCLWPEQKSVGLQILIVMAGASIVAYFLAPAAITFVVGPSFVPSIAVFRLLLPVLLGLTLVELMTNQWIGRGMFLPTTYVTITTAVANIVLNSVMIPKFGMMGAVWATLISFTGVAVITQLWFVFRCEAIYRKTR